MSDGAERGGSGTAGAGAGRREGDAFVPPPRLSGLPTYPLAEIPALKARLAAEGRRVIDLGAGDAGLPVPAAAVRALREAVGRAELQGYAYQRGLPELRQAISDWMERRFGRRPDPEREVLPLVGSKEGLAHLAVTAAEPGDTVLVPDPGYAAYAGGAYLAGARIERVPLRAEEGFLVPPDRIREAPGRLRLVYLNYPNNPTGAVAGPSYLERVLEACRERGALLAWDGAYSEVAFDGFRPPGLLEVDGGTETGVEFHSFSKSFNMTGWRLGWACGSPAALEALARVKSFFDTGAYLGIQAAGAAVLREAEGFLEENVSRLGARRDAAVEAFREAGFDVTRPRATLYLWMPVPTGEPSAPFCRRILSEAAVVLLPGAAMGSAGEGWVRAALTVPPETFPEAAARVGRSL